MFSLLKVSDHSKILQTVLAARPKPFQIRQRLWSSDSDEPVKRRRTCWGRGWGQVITTGSLQWSTPFSGVASSGILSTIPSTFRKVLSTPNYNDYNHSCRMSLSIWHFIERKTSYCVKRHQRLQLESKSSLNLAGQRLWRRIIISSRGGPHKSTSAPLSAPGDATVGSV